MWQKRGGVGGEVKSKKERKRGQKDRRGGRKRETRAIRIRLENASCVKVI